VKKLIWLVMLLLALGGFASIAKADSTTTYNLTIQKYGLTPGATGFKNPPKWTGQTINNLPVYDTNGNEVQALADISYVITNTATGAVVATITTDSKGTATISLPMGTYSVQEEANPLQGLVTPAAAVIVSLPYSDSDNGLSEDGSAVIYPKSSLEKQIPPSSSKPSTSTPPSTSKPALPKTSKPKGFLPQTGDAVTALASVGVVLLMIVLFAWSRRQNEEEKS
jgi:LPXTG-motif cell wall-anchored protein